MSSLLDKVHASVHSLGSEVVQRVNASKTAVRHSHTHLGVGCDDGHHERSDHRYGSFAPQRVGNDAKWYVDGCGYMWAVSRALECAEKSIWILDCEHPTFFTVIFSESCSLTKQKGGSPRNSTYDDHLRSMRTIVWIECCWPQLKEAFESTSSCTRRSPRP